MFDKIFTPDLINKIMPADLIAKIESTNNDFNTIAEKVKKIEEKLDIIIEKLEEK